MFVTQSEIVARLASDDNLLTSLLVGRPSDLEDPSNRISEERDDKESLKETIDETTSANTRLTSFVSCNEELINERDGVDVNDVKLQRILDEADQEQGTRDKTRDEGRRSGRPADAINRSHEQRADIALMGSVLGHGLAADLLGISTSSSSLHARGVVSHGEEIDFDLDKIVKRKLHKIRNKSADALIKVLDNADSASMYEQIKTAKDAVFVANQLASVIQKVQPQEQEQKPTAQFVIMR